MGLVDDIIGISAIGIKAQQMNALLNIKTAEKGLRFGPSKCQTMIVGRKNIKIRKINNIVKDENMSNKLKDIPEEVKHLVNKDDIVYVVPGDGSCAPGCASAWLFHKSPA